MEFSAFENRAYFTGKGQWSLHSLICHGQVEVMRDKISYKTAHLNVDINTHNGDKIVYKLLSYLKILYHTFDLSSV